MFNSKKILEVLEANHLVLKLDENKLLKASKEYQILGYELTESLKEFLAYFAYHVIKFKAGSNDDEINFNVSKVLKRCPKYYVKGMESNYSMRKIIPFGLVYTEHMIFFSDEKDWTYACYDDLVILFGHSQLEALENIFNDKEMARFTLPLK
ncbi:MAG: hypothetical protein WKF97_04300 [Chitinophagaceae bacterium]